MYKHYSIKLDEKEVADLRDFLSRNGIAGNLEVLAYIACNIGIRHGPSMGIAWEEMQKTYKQKFGEDTKHYGAITGSFRNLPEAIAPIRIELAGSYANEPFDMIVYREIS